MLQVSLRISPVPNPFLSLCMFPASFFDVYITGFESIGLFRVFKWLRWIRLEEGAFYISREFIQGFGCIFVFQVPELAAILDF
eukprot:snap_masked-scaffold_16-processed-gene-1.50-mRNA-1 protein AED:1.00 eAED:1.00 QI:0/0/0/0/1/1/2/0/82